MEITPEEFEREMALCEAQEKVPLASRLAVVALKDQSRIAQYLLVVTDRKQKAELRKTLREVQGRLAKTKPWPGIVHRALQKTHTSITEVDEAWIQANLSIASPEPV